MHFLLFLLRLALDRFIPTWRDGLTMAARADGRIEHIPTRPNLWDRCLNLLGLWSQQPGQARGKVRAVRGRGALRDPATDCQG